MEWRGNAAKQDSSRFHIRCSDGSRTLCLLWTDITLVVFLDNVCFRGQCLAISDRVCVNSRTLDIGNDCCPVLRHSPFTLWLWDGGVG